jgi:selenocysteine lyase/cysteine desulfurase
MLGPYGHAFGYFSERALNLIDHNTGNWVVSPNSKVVYQLLDYTTDTLPGARKYDRGQASNMLTLSCLEAGLDLLGEIGLQKVRQHNQKVRDYFLDNYPKEKFELITPIHSMGNILSLKAKGIDPLELERELKFRNVDVSVRQGNIRLSFHIFNTEEQVNTLIEALDI